LDPNVREHNTSSKKGWLYVTSVMQYVDLQNSWIHPCIENQNTIMMVVWIMMILMGIGGEGAELVCIAFFCYFILLFHTKWSTHQQLWVFRAKLFWKKLILWHVVLCVLN